MPRYRLILENGRPAEPRIWQSMEGGWRRGDRILAGDRQYEIVAVEKGGAVLVVKRRIPPERRPA